MSETVATIIAGAVAGVIILLVVTPMILNTVDQSAETMNIKNESFYQQSREGFSIIFALLVFASIIAGCAGGIALISRMR